MTGRPTLGVLPWREDLWLDAEDSLDLDSRPRAALPPHGTGSLRIAVVRLPRMSNVTDVDPLAAEPGVIVDLATTPAQLDGADLVILPGTRATVSDLGWLREAGLAAAIAARAARGGRCSASAAATRCSPGRSATTWKAARARCAGLGLLPATVSFAAAKTLARPSGAALGEPSPATRSTTGRSPPRAASRSSTGARPGRSAARPGTASSRATGSGARSCATWPPGAAASSPPRPA